MNESIRTFAFVAVAAVVALGAYASRPSLDDRTEHPGPKADDPLFPAFKDPLQAKSLEIKQFDEAQARVTQFEVTQQPSGLWTIPSHGNYPADAESQLKAVAETLADLKVVGIASDEKVEDKKKELELYGVNDPSTADVGTKGVGTLIAMQDAKGNDLLRLVVGKEVAGATNQRFVRKPSEDLVYVTTIDLTKLPTDFDKWIEKDLLKLSTFDVSKATVKDYLVGHDRSGRPVLRRRLEAALSYDNSKGEWTLDDLSTFRGAERVKSELGELEEVNKQKLDDLRNALGDLKIVDVRHKPEGLGNSLRVSSDKLTNDQIADLMDLGFYPTNASAEGKLDILGANGEVVIDTKDGVEYVLRFGDIAPQTTTSTSKKTDAKSNTDKSGKSEDDEIKVHRWLFVTTQLAPSILKQPELEPEPAGPEATEEKKADDKKDGDKKDGDKTDDDKKGGEKKEGDAKADEKNDEAKPATVDPQQAERERIKKENERKLNAYRDQRKKAEQRVAELNARFADWYYVVAEDVYKKIHLVRSDIVKEKAIAKDEGFGIDAFRKLEDDGLKTELPKP
jgi:hypothetical protein